MDQYKLLWNINEAYTVREIQKRSWEFLGNYCAQFLRVMFLEFISNLAEKFSNITGEIQKLASKKARNNPEKLRENKMSAASTEDRTEELRDKSPTS